MLIGIKKPVALCQDRQEAGAPAPVDTMQALPVRDGRLPILGLPQGTFRTFAKGPGFFLGFSLLTSLPGLIHLLRAAHGLRRGTEAVTRIGRRRIARSRSTGIRGKAGSTAATASGQTRRR